MGMGYIDPLVAERMETDNPARSTFDFAKMVKVPSFTSPNVGRFQAILESVVSSKRYLDDEYQCPICDNSAFPCGCFKTPAMENEVDTAIRDYRAKRFDPYLYFVQDKLCLWKTSEGDIKVARWDRENGRAIRAILSTPQQELYQALLQQRLYTLNLTLK